MAIVLALEGVDGSGKSSLAGFLQRLCREQGRSFTLVGRGEATSGPLVGKLTRLLREEPGLTPPAEVFVRLAREHQRARLAASVASGVVVLDRFVLSDLALIRLNGLDPYPFLHLLRDLVSRAHLYATVLVRCPFEVAERRARERDRGGAGYERHNAALRRRLGEFLEDDFESGTLTGQQWPVDNAGELGAAEAQLRDYLMPHLHTGRPLRPASSPDVTVVPSSSAAEGASGRLAGLF
jgi:thymidylate kinase